MNECANLLSMIDKLIAISEPLRAEYLRGFNRGVRVSVLGVSEETIEEHRMVMDHSGGGSGDPFIDSYARGYRHGFEGMKPESPSTSSNPPRSLQIASIV